MAYVSLYRKYRSQTFSDLVGQEHVVRTLQNGIATGRIAHSYLLTGPRGTGKTSTARLLAKALCCEMGPTPEPDNTCEICRSITLGSCIDVIEMDAASESGVEGIREQIVQAVEYKPMLCRYKVFIIDEVHDLSRQAFDALLKTVEEPPPHIVFILATTEFNKVPPTIRSRCQKHEFHRAGMGDLVGRLEFVLKGEGLQAEPAAVSAIARMADGGYRDALTLLEQAIITSDGQITLQQVYDQLGLVGEDTVDDILHAMKQGAVPEVIRKLEQIAQLGRDPRAILESMMYRLSDLTRAAYQVQESGSDAVREASLHETAVRLGKDTILSFRAAIAEAHKAIRDVSLPRLWLESELIRLASAPARPVQNVAAPRPAEPPAPRKAVIAERPEEPAKVPPQESAKAPPQEEKPPESTGDAELDRARAAWHHARASLASNSALMRNKLAEAVLIGRDGTVVTIQLEREMEYDWIHAQVKRAPAILAALQEHLGEPVEIRYHVRRKEGKPEEAAAVELPLEGQRLEQLMKDTFGADKAVETREE